MLHLFQQGNKTGKTELDAPQFLFFADHFQNDARGSLCRILRGVIRMQIRPLISIQRVGIQLGDSLTLREILAIPHEQDRDTEETFSHELERRHVSRSSALIALAVCGMAMNAVRSDDGYCNTFNGTWKPCDELDAQYRFLTSLGYPMSDFEKSLQDKSHEFFKEARE